MRNIRLRVDRGTLVSLAKRVFIAAKTTVAMTVQLGRATGRPDQAANYALHHLFRRDVPVKLAWQGFRLSARGIDWPALQEVLIEGEYGALTPFLADKPAPVVLDLGANIGTFGLFVFSVARGATVHSYEPSEATFALLSGNASIDPGVDWRNHCAAAWSEDGTISFANAATSTAGHVSTAGLERVPALSLASILQRCGGHIDVAKIDIEGAEEALLVDRVRELRAIDTLVVELHPNRCNSQRVAQALSESYGQIYRIPGRRSSKPLLLATRLDRAIQLPIYSA